MIIQNASDIPINQQSATVPDVGGALLNWFQQMTFVLIQKQTVNFQLVERERSVSFLGVIQPLKARDLMLKPEGERAWTWNKVHADPSLQLKVDDVIKYLDTRFRVMARTDYKIYGYIRYELVQDWEKCS